MKRKFALAAAAVLIASAVAPSASAQSFRDGLRARANTASVAQAGSGNGAGVAQTGRGNDAVILQAGRNNTGTIQQDGANNAGCLVQVGNNNDGAIVQSGNNNNVGVVQGVFGTHVMSAERCSSRARSSTTRFILGVR